MKYSRFAAMIATSTVAMYGLMYLHTYVIGHVYWSQTRAWMAVIMGSCMAAVMLGFMWRMYRNRAANLAVLAGAAVTFALALWFVRSQSTVDDVSYMEAMIPHHSIAILTSRRARIEDPRVRELADAIIRAQEHEIALMQELIEELKDQRRPRFDNPGPRIGGRHDAAPDGLAWPGRLQSPLIMRELDSGLGSRV